MSKNLQLSLIAMALVSSLSAENQYTLETINVSSAQGTTLKKKDVTDSVTIITKEAIEEARVSTLDEALNKLGALSMTQNGGAGKATSFFIRGMGSQRILVLIDGVRYNNPTGIGAAAEFSQIMLNNVEQIEIIKGAQSGVWGSDASGGVINIITSKAKQGTHATANVEYGSFDTAKTSLQASYATEDFDILVGGTLYDSDGFSAVEKIKSDPEYGKRFDELGFEKDLYKNQSFNAKLGYNVTNSDRLEAQIQTVNSLVYYDDTPFPSFLPADSDIPNTFLQNRFYTLAYKHTDSIQDLKLNYNQSTFDRTIEGAFGVSTYKGSVNEVKVDDKINYMQDSFIRVGASYQKFEQEEITANTTKSYSATSAFLTNYNKLTLLSDLNTIVTESIRYDSYDNFDNSLTGKLGIKQFVYEEFYISTNIGTGYNAPTLGQLYGAYGANPNLKPEESLTADFTLGNDIFWVTGFYNEITDLIDYDWSLGYVQTSGTSKFKGLELGYEDFYFDVLGLGAMYTYVKTEDADAKELARRPKEQLDIRATYYATEEFDIGLNAQYIGERYDKADKAGAQTGKYTVVNFVLNNRVNKYITLYGKIDNITDLYYQTVDGYATAGRSLYIGLNAKY